MYSTATFSKRRRYRYTLWRIWGNRLHLSYVVFIGLNPSTATETKNDPTVSRCIKYTADWGYSGLCMLNIFAFRATDPKVMKAAKFPIGAKNDEYLIKTCKGAEIVVAAWGNHGSFMDRGNKVKKMLPDLHYLRLTKQGNPWHPLYLPKDLKPIRWE